MITSGSDENTTKQKILSCAAYLFAGKGFTETSIRELADAVGVKGSSIYNHFPSKNTILEHMLEDYAAYNIDVFEDRNIKGILRENPTSEGILKCLQLNFPADRVEFHLNVLCVLFQEQLRNPVVRKYVAEHIIMRAERNVRSIVDELKKLRIIRQDTDPDYWVKASSSLFYSFAARMMLGIGDKTPDFSGRGMEEMLRYTFDMMLEKFGEAGTAGGAMEMG